MRKILTVQMREKVYYLLTIMDCSLMNWKDAAKVPEEQESYYT